MEGGDFSNGRGQQVLRLLRGSEHEGDGRAGAGLCHVGDSEPLTLVERDGAWVESLEVSGQMTLVDHRQTPLEQLAPEAAPLHGEVDAKPGQIPVRILGVRLIHPL